MALQTFILHVPDPVPDSSVGRDWAVKRLDPGRDSQFPPPQQEVALLETAGAAYLTRAAARHLAALLLNYAEEK